MPFFVTPGTVTNTRRLNLRRLGGQMLGRGLRVVPRNPLTSRTFWRILFDQAPMRYCIALSPFPIAMAVRPDLALAISQAPLLMFALVFTLESSVLSIQNPQKRRALMDEAEAQRGLDILSQRARDALARLAAGRNMAQEELHLIVEQSGLARVPVLTLVSVQIPSPDGRAPDLLDLTEEEQSMIAHRLFDEDFTEDRLHRINQRENRFIRDIALEARTVSAHQRLMAMAGKMAEA